MTTPHSAELGSITKHIHIAAPPDVVYEVISRPEHIAQWWTDGADLDPTLGGTGVLVWRERATTRRDHDYGVPLTVIEAVPGERLSFRWNPDSDAAITGDCVLVTFALTPDGPGTLLTVTETGLREQGWDAAVLEEYYASHDHGWTRHLADLATYAVNLVTP